MANTRLTQLGALVFLVGFVKAWTHTTPEDPFVAFWCRTSAIEEPDLFVSAGTLLQDHCWGCPVAGVGAALMILGVWRAAKHGRRRSA